MNKVFLVGNLTKDPESKTTQSGINLCTFTIAVNRRRNSNEQAGQQEADFFRITAWRQLAQNCVLYLTKGKKVSVVGSVECNAYIGKDGKAYASMEVTADEIEFLSPRNYEAAEQNYIQQERKAIQQEKPISGGYVCVNDEELPF